MEFNTRCRHSVIAATLDQSGTAMKVDGPFPDNYVPNPWLFRKIPSASAMRFMSLATLLAQ
jgi:hypothetical protein